MTDIAQLDATAQADLVRRGECSATELLDATIDAIERLNPTLNAVIVPLYEQARDQIARGDVGHGPFHGVPILLKDLGAALAGTPQYGGTRVLRDRAWISLADSELTRRFRRAGFVFTGKANTPELGLSPTTEPDTFGPTRNPWNPERIVGGSSGGSAAAVAARMVAVAHAGDGGGSIRNPAGACGVVGLKPSRGRSTLGPDRGESWSGCVTEGVITRSVRDTAAILDCTSGYLAGDPATAPPPARPFAAEVGRDPGRLRVGMFWGNAETPGTPDARAAVERCATLLAELGHQVDDDHPAELDRNELGAMLYVSVAASVAHELAIIAADTGSPVGPDGVEPATWSFAERGRSMSATEYLANVDEMHRYARRLCAWWADGNDLLITPTMAEPAPPIGELKGADVERIVRLVPYTAPFNVSGQPAIALPLYWTADDLPVGIQLVAAYGREDLLIQVAAQLEAAAPWADRTPQVSA
ncbi:MAG TPA: amidase [Acidimicrobiales bacterium]|jgi:amidase|nr:amidase [Acidimicrobiales bacterium]